MPGLLTLNLSNPSRVKAQALLHWLWPRAEDVWVLTEIGGDEGSRLIEAVCRQAGYSVTSSDVITPDSAADTTTRSSPKASSSGDATSIRHRGSRGTPIMRRSCSMSDAPGSSQSGAPA
ncbi:hypothetical protein GCM10027599_14990 [Yimella radicis]